MTDADFPYRETGEMEDKQFIIEQMFEALSAALAPKYSVERPDDFSFFEVGSSHIATALSITCEEGEGDEDEINRIIARVMEQYEYLHDATTRNYLVDTSEVAEDDLLEPFTGIQPTPENPEVDAFIEALFEQYVLEMNMVGRLFHSIVWEMNKAGLTEEQAEPIAVLACQMYGGGADLHAYVIQQLDQWDRDHPDGPTSLMVGHRAFKQLEDHSRLTMEQLEVIMDRAREHHVNKHHWRFHQFNLMTMTSELFHALWEEGAPPDYEE